MTFHKGDRVQFTHAHCQRMTGGDPFCDIWTRVGTVRGKGFRKGMYLVHWDGDREPTNVWHEYITRPGTDAHCRIDEPNWAGYETAFEKPRRKWR